MCPYHMSKHNTESHWSTVIPNIEVGMWNLIQMKVHLIRIIEMQTDNQGSIELYIYREHERVAPTFTDVSLPD